MRIFNRGKRRAVLSNGLADPSKVSGGNLSPIPGVIPTGQGIGDMRPVNALSVPGHVNRMIAALAHAGKPVE